MKIVIINPPAVNGVEFVREGRCEQRLSSFQYNMVPISLPYMAAALREAGHEVAIIDCIADRMDVEGLIDRSELATAQLGVLNFATGSYDGDRYVSEELRARFSMHLTAIGNHVTSLPEVVLGESGLDSVILGEPEQIVVDLAQRVAAGVPLGDLKGVAHKTEGDITVNDRAPFIDDLDALPFPARDLLDNSKYTLPFINEPYTLITTSRGCPYSCTYCTAFQYFGKRLRLRSAGNVVDEIEEIVHKHGIRNVTMWSDTFTQNRQFVVDVCQEILRRGVQVRWMCNSRVDTVDKEMLQLMKESGCIGISYGVESGVQEILDNVKKNATLQQARDAFRWMREVGIESLAHLILGLPGETTDTVEETIQFAIDLDPDYAQFYCAIPFPGTEFLETAQEENWIEDRSWSQYEINHAVINTPELSKEELESARARAYRAFYLRPHYVFMTLRRIRTLRDLRLTFVQGIDFLRNWVLKPPTVPDPVGDTPSSTTAAASPPPRLPRRSALMREA